MLLHCAQNDNGLGQRYDTHKSSSSSSGNVWPGQPNEPNDLSITTTDQTVLTVKLYIIAKTYLIAVVFVHEII